MRSGSVVGGKEGISNGHSLGASRCCGINGLRTEPSSTIKIAGLVSLLEQQSSGLGGGDGSSDNKDFSNDDIDESADANNVRDRHGGLRRPRCG